MPNNTDNPFEYQMDDTGADDTPSEETNVDAPPAPEKDAEEKPVEESKPENDFDYADDIKQMEADASISDDDPESDAKDGETNSADDSEKAPEKDSGNLKSEPTQEQLFQAAQLGLTLDDVKGLDSRGLSTAIRIAEKVKPADKPAENADEQEQDEALFKPIALEGLDEFDEDTQGLVKGIQDQFNENMAKMAEELIKAQVQLGESQEAVTQQHQSQFQQEFDRSITDLGEEWADVFGTDRDSASNMEFDNRVKLITEMDKLARSHEEMNIQQLFDTAMRVSFSEEMNTKNEQQKKNSRSKHRQDRSTARPSQRNRSIENMKPGREKALAMVKEKGKKKFFGLFGG